MGTEIRSWQILDGKLVSSDMALKREGRTEPYDLEPWMASHPESIEADMMIIGGQVTTTSGRIDLFGTGERPFETAK
jgi:RecB family endonuclease NucS